MEDTKKTDFDTFKLYLGTAEKVSDRRGAANSWMLSVNSAIVGFYGYLSDKSGVVTADERAIWQWAIPISGVLVCFAWIALLQSYAALNRAKFTVLQEMEADLTYPMFLREWQSYKADGRRGLAKIESWIPWCFTGLYAAVVIAAIL